jgi:hypothetical protein
LLSMHPAGDRRSVSSPTCGDVDACPMVHRENLWICLRAAIGARLAHRCTRYFRLGALARLPHTTWCGPAV